MSVSSKDVQVYSVRRTLWPEIASFDGDFITRNDMDDVGILAAATIAKTDNSHGPINIYYSISLNENKADVKLIGYDLYSEKNWEKFLIRNGFNLSEDRKERSISVQMYAPTWSSEASETDSQKSEEKDPYAQIGRLN